MKKSKLIKSMSVIALAATLTACGKTKTVKEEWTDEEKQAWAQENGYEQWTQAEKDAYAEQWAEDNGYAPVEVEDTRPELEVAFGTEMSVIDAPYLANYIGKVGVQETFGDKKDMLVFYGINECATCDAIKPIVNEWVAETGNKVYYYNPDNSAALAADKAAVLKKLGSTDGTTLTGPLLIAFVDGVKVDSISGTEITEASINLLASTYFKTDAGEKTVNASKELETLKDLRVSIANDEQFILYATRFNCPWCRKLADTARDNALNKLMRSYTGNLYTITSEKVMGEYNNIFVKEVEGELTITTATDTSADVMTAWEWLYAQDNGATPDVVNTGANIPSYWPNTATAVQKAEVLLYLVATGEVTPHVTNGAITAADQVAFLEEVAAYAADTTRTKKFVATDRNIPAFIAVGWTQEQEEDNATAVSAIVARRSSMVEVDFEEGTVGIVGATANRALFPEYYTGATSGVLTKDDNGNFLETPADEVTAAYYYLTMWVNSWVYDTPAA